VRNYFSYQRILDRQKRKKRKVKKGLIRHAFNEENATEDGFGNKKSLTSLGGEKGRKKKEGGSQKEKKGWGGMLKKSSES